MNAEKQQLATVALDRSTGKHQWIQIARTGDVTDTHVDWIYRRGRPTVPSPVVEPLVPRILT